MCKVFRNMSGLPEDDVTILNESALWRRIRPEQTIFDANLGRLRPTSDAFGNSSDDSGMSVIIGDQVLEEGRTPQQLLHDFPGFSLAAFQALLARERGQIIIRDPIPEEPAHAEVIGKKTGSVKSAFAKHSTWVVPPSNVVP